MKKDNKRFNAFGIKNEKLTMAIIVLLAAAVIAVAIYVIVGRVTALSRGKSKYENINAEAVTEDYQYNNTVAEEENEEVENPDPRAKWLEDNDGKIAYHKNVDANKLIEINDNYIGWIYGCGGDVDYPICQSDDEQYYLKHGFDNSRNIYGSLFTEALDNGLLYTDAVVYGHHMKDGAMFQKLCEYKEESYFKEHPYFYVYTNRGDAQFEVFSAYYIDAGVLDEIQERDADMERGEYIQSLKDRSLYDTSVEVSGEDKILTLVTCEYTTPNGRMILHCKKAEE